MSKGGALTTKFGPLLSLLMFETFMRKEGFKQVVSEKDWKAWCHTVQPVLVTCDTASQRCEAVFAMVSTRPRGVCRLLEPQWATAYSTCIHDPKNESELFSAAMADLQESRVTSTWEHAGFVFPTMSTPNPVERSRRQALLPSWVVDCIFP